MNQSLSPRWDAPLAERLMDRFRLRRAGRFSRLSLGERRKVLLLVTLCQGAELLILDEPTLGLDVESRHVFLECLLEFACQGDRTVLLSSHLLSDVERVVDRVAMLRDGRLVTQGVLEDLKEGIRKLHFPAPVSRDELSVHFKILSYDGTQPRQTVATVSDFTDDKLQRLVGGLPQTGELRTQRFNLEDIFVALMNSVGD
jgi:ABC-2 type transport system ATP-binding protein